LRETLFNILAPRIKGTRFLDLCAGSGAVGIEALSRGAAHATFVDQARKMCALIEANLDEIGVDENDVEVLNGEAVEFLRRRAKKEGPPFDIIFFDPPYEADYDVVLERLCEDDGVLLAAAAIVVVEHYKKRELAKEFGALHRYRTLEQGDSVLSFYERTAA
jgi:16S rRNA (guanine(966)-N(2))-methyltransferase RsmD